MAVEDYAAIVRHLGGTEPARPCGYRIGWTDDDGVSYALPMDWNAPDQPVQKPHSLIPKPLPLPPKPSGELWWQGLMARWWLWSEDRDRALLYNWLAGDAPYMPVEWPTEYEGAPRVPHEIPKEWGWCEKLHERPRVSAILQASMEDLAHYEDVIISGLWAQPELAETPDWRNIETRYSFEQRDIDPE